MVVLDTSVLARYFTGDDRVKAKKAAELLESEEDLLVPEVVFVETEYVLKKLYKASRKQVLEVFNFLISRRNMEISTATREAVEMFGKNNLSLADCLVAVAAKGGRLASFDEKLLKINGVENYWF